MARLWYKPQITTLSHYFHIANIHLWIILECGINKVYKFYSWPIFPIAFFYNRGALLINATIDRTQNANKAIAYEFNDIIFI